MRAGLEGWGCEDGGALGPAVAYFDDGGRGEEGRRAGYVGKVAFYCAEELEGGFVSEFLGLK